MEDKYDKQKVLNNEISLLKAFENEDFSKLKDLQSSNQYKLKKNFFIKKLNSIIKKKFTKIEQNSLKTTVFSKLETHLKDLIIGINDFKIEKNHISSGASSFVYKGTFKFIDIAIKKINLTSMSAKQLKSIFNELLILSRLRHPNIIMLLGVSIDEENALYIITELYPKNSLRDYIKLNPKLKIKSKLDLLFEIARALNYIHSLNPPILHRDIKPENIFISSDFSAKLGDFGIAKEYFKETPQNFNTDTCSTLEYMSPETLNFSVYYKQSDIYSFGVLAYEVLTGKDYTNKNGFEFINDIVDKKFRPSLKDLDDWPVLQKLICLCWDDEWKKRPNFEDICVVLSDLEGFGK